VHGAVEVVLRERVLLEEFVLDDLRSFENSLLIFREGVFSDQLHDFGELVFLLKDLLDSFTIGHELWVVLGVVLSENSIVVREGNVPVNTGEMLTLGKLLVQTPKDLYDRKSG